MVCVEASSARGCGAATGADLGGSSKYSSKSPSLTDAEKGSTPTSLGRG